jgi:DNA-binding MarR family transcriptional regulator
MLSRFSQFCFGISAIHRAVQKIERDEMERYGNKGAYAQYLVAMIQYPDGITASQLCELCDRDKAAVSRAAAEMEEKGLIRREGSHYRAKLFLTQAGQDAAQFVCKRAVIAVMEAGKGLSDEDRATFYNVLHRIASNLQTLSKEGLPKTEGE